MSKIHDKASALHDAHHHEKAPFWVRHYDGIVRLASFGRSAKVHRHTLRLTGIEAGHNLLDIGCGTGDFLLLAEQTMSELGRLTGLDPETGMIEQAQRKARAVGSQAIFDTASIEAIPCSDNSVDVVTSSLMMHHLTEEQQAKGLAEISRVLKPGGRLVVVDLNTSKRSLATSVPGHRRDGHDSVQHDLPDQLRAAGFTDVQAGRHQFKALSYAVGHRP